MRYLASQGSGLLVTATLLLSPATWATELPAPLHTLLHSALAWEARDRDDLARSALEKFIAARPDRADVLEQLGELQLRNRDFAAARTVLRTLQTAHRGSESLHSFSIAVRLATTDRLKVASIRRMLDLQHWSQARSQLQALLPEGPPSGVAGMDYYGLLSRFPDGWDAARRGYEALVGLHPDDPRYRLALARHLLSRADTAAAGQRLLETLRRRDDVSPRMLADALAAAAKIRNTRVARNTVDPAPAPPALPLELPSDTPETLPAQANTTPAATAVDLSLAERDRLRAITLDERAAQRLAQGDEAGALADLQQAHDLNAQDPWIALRLARRYAAGGAPDKGRSLMQGLATAAQGDADTHFAQALYLESRSEWEAARLALSQIAANTLTDTMQALAERLAVAGSTLELESQPALVAQAASRYLSTGYELLDKPGSPGISSLTAWKWPVEWHLGQHAGMSMVLHTDVVRLDAGHTVTSATPLLGTAPLVPVLGYPGIGALTGLSLGVDLSTSTLAADLGATPTGFPVTNLVGGIRYSPTIGPVDVSIGLSRRAVTGSILSYAGLIDPGSGRTWGGVVQTGPTVQAGYYRQEGSLQGALSVAQLTGKHVLDNSYVGARLAGDRRLIAGSLGALYAGAVVTYWSYAENLLNDTYGSGGYYSPQSYLSVALPLEVVGLKAGFSYRVRASLNRTSSHQKSMDFYPTNSALQALAGTKPLPGGYSSPIFPASRTTETSYSLTAALEHTVGPDLVMGAVLTVDRASYYRPTTLMLYVRIPLPGSTVSVATPPRPTRSYAER